MDFADNTFRLERYPHGVVNMQYLIVDSSKIP